ncbi:MAG: ABC transporter permease [Candidatus Aminicenantes bacterium]|nr:ABC transporter permease [Candidatus Aminicenantes bacterium]
MPTSAPGRFVLGFARHSGGIFLLAVKAFAMAFRRPLRLRLVVSHLYLDGIKSIPVIFLMSVFTGGVLALQSFYGLQRFGAEVFTGSLVGVSLTKELIPVLTGLMLAGRVSASYSAEIGTMAVTEQVDALFTFGVNPVQYLVSPRLAALLLMAPLLTLFGDFVGIMGGKVVATLVVNQNPNLFDSQLFRSLEIWDVLSGIIKSVFFGGAVAIVGSYFGLQTEGGARGVGRATTTAVVTASVIILVSDFFWSKILPFSLR